MMDRVGVQSGAPYNNMGFIRESNRVESALKESWVLFIVLLRPKNARVALLFRSLMEY